MAYKNLEDLIVYGAKINFRNFAGRETEYERAGKRSFVLVLDGEDASRLKDQGWNIRIKESEDGESVGYLNVAVRFDHVPPKIILVTGKKQNPISEDTVNSLDFIEIENVDLDITPYFWELKDGKSGVKAYLKTMYITQEIDPFAAKYSELEDAMDTNDNFPF